MLPSIFFRYHSFNGDEFCLKVSEENFFYLTHQRANNGRYDVTLLQGETDARKIEAGLTLIAKLAGDMVVVNDSFEGALQGLRARKAI